MISFSNATAKDIPEILRLQKRAYQYEAEVYGKSRPHTTASL